MRKIALRTKQLNSTDDIPSKTVKSDTSSLKNIIANQQKMLETQQRQTEALFSLAEKLLEKINVAPQTVSEPSSTPVRRSPVSSRLILSKTPRVRKNLAHYKDRLNTDL